MRRWNSLGFAVRLFLALLLSLVVVGVAAYEVISDRLYDQQIDSYVRTQDADARGFEDMARELPDRRVTIREIDEQLDGIGKRPGTVEALLIDSDGIVQGANLDALVGKADRDERIDAALASGTSYAGREADPSEDSGNFEFVTPLDLKGDRYALEMSFDESTFNAQLNDVRSALLLVMGFAGLAAAVLFYLLGGRTLMRHHRLALERATRDGLTDLPNQRAFEEDLSRAAAGAERTMEPLALALIDLDHFKLINDRYGHPQGDMALRRVAEVLSDVRPADRAYRIGGDEFALLMQSTDEPGAQIVLRRITRCLGEVDAGASIGFAAMRGVHSAEELRAEADAALYEAKRRGGGTLASFEEIRDRVSVTTTAKREALRRLLDEERLTTVFQPIWSFGSGDLLGVEALSRPDPSYGISGPAEAFDIAEQIGRVHDLDTMCAIRALLSAGELPDGALLFLNVTPRTLELDSDGSDWLLRATELAGIDPDRIVVEVTERMGSRIAPVLATLERHRDAGFKLALDDVGTGNAGLEMLRKIDADFVKIDRSIVAASATEPNARAVLLAMATFARQTGALVIAEGVEDEEVLEFLRGVGPLDVSPGAIIQGAQGFQLGYPSPEMPADSLSEIRDGRAEQHPEIGGGLPGSSRRH
jgi:diguanylate cyclase (GGDEF)-like protein